MTLSTRWACALVVLLVLAPPTFYIIFFDAPLRLQELLFSEQLFGFLILIPAFFAGRECFNSMRSGSDSPISDIRVGLRDQWQRMAIVAVLLVLIAIVSQFFIYNKNLIDTFVPFYLDPYLADFEHRILFGNHPWEITHWFLGDQATILIDRLYISWFAVVPILVGAIIFSRDTSFQFRVVLSLYFTWIVLGSFLAIAFSSVGPVFYEHFYGDPMFEPLNEELRRINDVSPLAQQEISQWLLNQRSEGGFGSGISAMPSVHVALAWLFYIVVRDRFENRLARFAALAFAIVTWIGSVHLAWHYVLDGLFSIIALSLFWRLLSKVTIGSGEPAAAPSQT